MGGGLASMAHSDRLHTGPAPRSTPRNTVPDSHSVARTLAELMARGGAVVLIIPAEGEDLAGLAAIAASRQAQATESGAAAFSVADAAKRLGIGRSLTWELIRTGDLDSLTVGKRRLVPADAIEAFLAGRRR